MASRFRTSAHASPSSIRRRRMLLFGSVLPPDGFEDAAIEAVLAKEVLLPYVAPAPLQRTPIRVVRHSISSENRTIDRSFSAEELDIPRTIPGLVSNPLPVSWLFVGDSFTPKNVTEPRPWRVYTNRFAGAVRAYFQRPKDVFIDATFPSARLSEVLFDFERRIAKFEPDICFLSLCLAEAESKSVERFERMLVRLIRWAKKFDCQMVLQTPPCLPSRNDGELTRRLILVESIRGIAAEHAVPLVDHWEHWEWANTKVGQTENWVDSETSTPGEQGHRQLAKRLVQDLKLNDAAKPEFPVSIEEGVAVDE